MAQTYPQIYVIIHSLSARGTTSVDTPVTEVDDVTLIMKDNTQRATNNADHHLCDQMAFLALDYVQ